MSPISSRRIWTHHGKPRLPCLRRKPAPRCPHQGCRRPFPEVRKGPLRRPEESQGAALRFCGVRRSQRCGRRRSRPRRIRIRRIPPSGGISSWRWTSWSRGRPLDRGNRHDRGGPGGERRGGGDRQRRTQYRVQITGLPSSGSWQDLKDHMRDAGDVCFADVFRDGTGIVEYVRSEDMKYALRKLDDTKFKSHEGETSYIRVREADADSGRDRSRSPLGRRGSPQYSPRRSRSRSRSYRSPSRSRSRSRS
ncbi:hypothetical protein L596_018566 [Steinernema carpocapsae]|uniref:RRM domain-containing protein n=1 Tax=Steinernema carpocapsae TaxID=34508 RepID=A0A4U5N5R6_STECR|nr:hypothetical protein L596_018566 [Steinernema carpocapsae]